MKFNKQQEEIINTIDGNIAVIATAGSGKTSSLTYRIENMVGNHNIPPSSILAVTFSRKAKDTIIERLKVLGVINVNVETFHSVALKIIGYAYGINTFKVWTTQWEKEKVINDTCLSMSLCSDATDVPFNEIMTFIALQKTNMLKPTDELIYKDDIPFSKEDMKKIYVQYEDYKKKKSYIEFDDFLNIVNDIFDERPDVLQKYQNVFQYVLVDEFQDVSMAQSLFLKKLNANNTLIVGDPLQAIYSFRGGDSKYILNFDEDYKDVKVINLNTNYRCSKDIVTTANILASSIPGSHDKNYVESVAAKENNKIPELRHFFSDSEEYEFIAKKIDELKVQGYNYNNVAILARTNAQLQKLETVLHKSNVDFDVVEGKLFTEQMEIKLILSYLRLSVYENDDESFMFLYNKPNRWLNKKFLEETKENSIKRNVSLYNAMFTIDRRNWRFKNGIDEIHEVINYLQNKKYKNIGELVHYLRERLDIDTFVTKGKQSDDGKYIEQIENLNSFEEMCANYTTIKDLITYLDKMNKDMENVKKDSVKLLTIHKSKGMEFPVVFIIGCNDGILPHAKSDDLYDEKRLLYVAITRAEKELYMSYADLSNGGFKDVSPFIKDLGNTVKKIDNVDQKEK